MKEGCERCLSKFMLPLAFIVCALGLTGCASTGTSYAQTPHAQKQTTQTNYEFMDRHGDLRLVRRNNDLYLEKLDGSEIRRVTNTPSIIEVRAYFDKDKEKIVYSTCSKEIWREYKGKSVPLSKCRCYSQPIDGDGSQKIWISQKEFLQAVVPGL